MKTIEYTATNYRSDLIDAQWEVVVEYFPQYGIIDSQSVKTIYASAVIFQVKFWISITLDMGAVNVKLVCLALMHRFVSTDSIPYCGIY